MIEYCIFIWIIPVRDYQNSNQLHRNLLHRLDRDYLDDVPAKKINNVSFRIMELTEPPSMTIDLCDRASEMTEWASSSSRFFLSCLIRRYILKITMRFPYRNDVTMIFASKNLKLCLTLFCSLEPMMISSLSMLLRTLSQTILHQAIAQKTLIWLIDQTQIWMKPTKLYHLQLNLKTHFMILCEWRAVI